MKNTSSFLGLLVALGTLGARAGERPPEIVRYYDQWIGCKAPPIQFDQSDCVQYAESNYKGKRVLLYSFDAGNFCDAPNMPALLQELTALRDVRVAAAAPLYVIGYTRGLMWPPCCGEQQTNQIPKEIDEVSHFPVVNLNNKCDEGALGEPYELLKSGPSAILIGTNGIITKIFPHPMTGTDFIDAVKAPAWHAGMKDGPKATAKQVWDRTPKRNIVVARRDITAGTILGHKHLNIDTVAESILPLLFFPANAYSNILGRALLKDAVEGQPLTADKVAITNGVPTTPRSLPRVRLGK